LLFLIEFVDVHKKNPGNLLIAMRAAFRRVIILIRVYRRLIDVFAKACQEFMS
jgi:hypothetical protein